MKYVFDEGRPKLPSCTIVATATLITANCPTPSVPSQRATIIPAATLLKIINRRVAKVHAIWDVKRISAEQEFHAKAQSLRKGTKKAFAPLRKLCVFA